MLRRRHLSGTARAQACLVGLTERRAHTAWLPRTPGTMQHATTFTARITDLGSETLMQAKQQIVEAGIREKGMAH